jgi:hypothetical protein
MGVMNVITDLMLVVFPMPVIWGSQMGLKRKFQLTILFALSLVPVAITLYRMPAVIDRRGNQQYRTLLASLEILAAASVSNALVLGSFVRDRGIKKRKFKFGSGSDSMDRASTRRGTGTAAAYWGSDEDLVRDLGMGLDPELRGSSYGVRPAPVAIPMVKQGELVDGEVVDLHGSNWQFPSSNGNGNGRREGGDNASNDSDMDIKIPEPARSPGDVSILTPRRVSFFDVGGLLDDEPNDRLSSRTASVTPEMNGRNGSVGSSTYDAAAYAYPNGRGGSSHLLQDIGGLLSSRDDSRHIRGSERERRGSNFRSSIRASPNLAVAPEGQVSNHLHPASLSPDGRHPSGIPGVTLQRSETSQSLQDVGGLLS